jgi:starch-binding outer membrane protein, SusD/RagB family
MIMQKLYKKITFLLGIVSFLGACEVLDQAPEHVITETNFWKTGNDAEAAIISGYDRMQGLWDGNIIALNVQSDEAISVTNNDRYDEFDRNAILADNNRAEQYWERNYNGIHRVNDVLKRVPGITDAAFLPETRERILGEAYFLRAYYYFNLVRLFGGVPLITEPYQTFKTDFTIPRATPEQVYTQIIADLTNAEQRLPQSYPTAFQTRGRATLGAAKALMARVFLYRKEYQQAAEKAVQVMAIPIYSLVNTANYASIFTPGGKNSTEGIFEVQYISSSQEGTDIWRRYLPSARNGSPANTGGDYWAAPSAEIINAFAPGDIRKDINIAVSTTPPFNQAGLPYVNKYKRTATGEDPNIYVIRLADVILIRAEALNELNQTGEAVQLVNQIRNRAGLPDTDAASQEELRNVIANERMLEFAFEGQRWHDLVRTGKAQAELGINENQLLWPIPARERNVNPRLEQNPGY